MSVALLVVAGLFVTGAGIAGLRRMHRLAGAAQGTIVDAERHFTGRSGAYFPVLSFRSPDGPEIRTAVPQGRIFLPPKVGKQVKVRYDPANPADALIDSARLRYGRLLLVIAGLGFLALAAVSLLHP